MASSAVCYNLLKREREKRFEVASPVVCMPFISRMIVSCPSEDTSIGNLMGSVFLVKIVGIRIAHGFQRRFFYVEDFQEILKAARLNHIMVIDPVIAKHPDKPFHAFWQFGRIALFPFL